MLNFEIESYKITAIEIEKKDWSYEKMDMGRKAETTAPKAQKAIVPKMYFPQFLMILLLCLTLSYKSK